MRAAPVLGVLFVLALPAAAAADALPDCPPGTHFVGNPIPEGALHHSGGQCVDDAETEADSEAEGAEGQGEGGGGCSIRRGRGAVRWLVIAAASVGLGLLSRRRR